MSRRDLLLVAFGTCLATLFAAGCSGGSAPGPCAPGAFCAGYVGADADDQDRAHDFYFGDVAPPASMEIRNLWPAKGLDDAFAFFFDPSLYEEGADDDDASGVDGVHLVYYRGHGQNTQFGTPPSGAPNGQLSLTAFGNAKLRYLLMCSCDLMAHGKDPSNPHLATPKPCGYEGTDATENAFYRWGSKSWSTGTPDEPALQPGLRMACGGSTNICGDDRTGTRVWMAHTQAGLGPADAYLAAVGGKIGGTETVGMCLSWGTSDEVDTPLVKDLEMTGESNLADESVAFVYGLYATTERSPAGTTSGEEELPGYWVTASDLPDQSVLDLATQADSLTRVYFDPGSGSVAYGDLVPALASVSATTDLDITEDLDAVEKLARDALESADIFPDEPTALSNAEVEIQRFVLDRKPKEDLCEGEVGRFLKGYLVRFWRTLDDGTGSRVRVSGPGGHAQAFVDGTGRITTVARVGWRTLVSAERDSAARSAVRAEEEAWDEASRLLPPDQSFERSSIELGYSEAPGACSQARLEPVYQLRFVPTGEDPDRRIPKVYEVSARPSARDLRGIRCPEGRRRR